MDIIQNSREEIENIKVYLLEQKNKVDEGYYEDDYSEESGSQEGSEANNSEEGEDGPKMSKEMKK